MPIGSDPVGAGFVKTLARPGGNITGLNAYSPELNGKRLEILKESLPKLAQVGLLVSGNFSGNDRFERYWRRRLSAANPNAFVGSRDGSDVEAVFNIMARKRIEAATVFPGQPTPFASRKQVVKFGAKNLKTAKHIGLTIPPHVLGRADKVIR